MSYTFSGLEIARSGLFASQKAIDVIGHNIANANTVGYTRQRLDMVSNDPYFGGGMLSYFERGLCGGGVKIVAVRQIRNEFIDRQYRNEHSLQQMWQIRSEALGYVEQLFDETGGMGISSCINQFFSSLSDLVNNPVDKEYRTSLVQNALKMTETFNHLRMQLEDKQAAQNEAIKISVGNINDMADNLSMLNEQILKSELNGMVANDLRDKRNLILDSLSGYMDITAVEQPDSTVTVEINGKTLVQGTMVNRLEVSSVQYNPVTGANDLCGITWQDDGSQLTINSGSLKGYLDTRDGDGTDVKGIPYFVSQLDALAGAIVEEVNLVHRAGWTMPDASNGNVSSTGVNFFSQPVDASGDPVPVTARNFTVSADIINNPYNIAASSVQITDDTLKGNNLAAIAMYELIDKSGIPVIGSFSGFVKSMAAGIGIETGHSEYMLQGQQALVDNLANRRASTSGVSIDEEVTEMVKFQHAYTAAARVITTIDEMIDTIVNRMGITGR